MTLIKKLLCVAYCICVISGSAYSQNLLDHANSYKYAEYLFSTHQYDLAAIEFERVIFLEPKDTLAKLKLVQSYRYLNNYNYALERIENFFPHNLNYLPAEFSDEYIKNLLYEHQYQEASVFLQNNNTLDLKNKAEYQLGVLAMSNHWIEANSFAIDHSELLSESEKYVGVNGIVMDGLQTRYKSPALAASLSAIIPGAGKAYTKQWKDAVYSFLFVSASIWLTYESYSKNGFAFNSIFWGSIAIGFYSANIYGSHKSAKRYNLRINQSQTRKVEDILLNDQRNKAP